MVPTPNTGENDRGPTSDEEENDIGNIPHPNFIINDIMTDSDESDDGDDNENDNEYAGYQMLPQDMDEDEGIPEVGQGDLDIGVHNDLDLNTSVIPNVDYEHVDTTVSHESSPGGSMIQNNLFDHSTLQPPNSQDGQNTPNHMKVCMAKIPLIT